MPRKLPSRKHRTNGEHTTDVAQSDLRRVRRCLERLEEARADFEASILAAYVSGESYRDIAEWAKLSHQRIAQIVKKGADDYKRGKSPGQE